MNHAAIPDSPSRTRRRWRDKFGEALRGWRLGARGQSSFAVHGFFAILAIGMAIVLRCTWVEWCLVALCIGGVLTAELVNSSIELLFRGLTQESRDRVFGCLDIAAGAVLMASATAVVVGGIVFGRRLLVCFDLMAE